MENMENLFIFIQDHGTFGCIIVVSDTIENARELMKDKYNYNTQEELQKYPITNGFVYANYGDM